MVIPAYSPKYAIAEESTIDKRILKKNAFTVISCFIHSTYKLSMQKNNHISFLSLIAMLFMSMQTFHHHDFNLSNNKLLNHDTESLINKDIHECDTCNLSSTKFFITENIVLLKKVFSIESSIVNSKTYFYKEIYKISNKSPPVV